MRGLALLPVHSLWNGADPVLLSRHMHRRTCSLFETCSYNGRQYWSYFGLSPYIMTGGHSETNELPPLSVHWREHLVLQPQGEEMGHGSNVCPIKTRKIIVCSLASFSASVAMYMRTALLWCIKQRVVVIPYRRFGRKTYRSHLLWRWDW